MPLDPNEVRSLYAEGDPAYMIFDALSGVRLDIPDPDRYPGFEVVRLFLTPTDAQDVIDRVVASDAHGVRNAVLQPVAVPLLATLREIDAENAAGKKVGYVIHGTDEVLDFV
jgi:hypothetical protein